MKITALRKATVVVFVIVFILIVFHSIDAIVLADKAIDMHGSGHEYCETCKELLRQFAETVWEEVLHLVLTCVAFGALYLAAGIREGLDKRTHSGHSHSSRHSSGRHRSHHSHHHEEA